MLKCHLGGGGLGGMGVVLLEAVACAGADPFSVCAGFTGVHFLAAGLNRKTLAAGGRAGLWFGAIRFENSKRKTRIRSATTISKT